MQYLFLQKGSAPYIPTPKGGGFTAHLVKSSETIDLGEEGIYTTYGPAPTSYMAAGFPHMPEFYYSMATNGDCYLNQVEIGYYAGCVPTSLSMATKLLGDTKFDYEGYFDYLGGLGYSFTDEGIAIDEAINLLGDCREISPYTQCLYNPYVFMQTILSGSPVVLCIEAGTGYSNADRFIRALYNYSGKSHAILLTGFFICDGYLGFEVYDPGSVNDPERVPGRGALIWESNLWLKSFIFSNSNKICAYSFTLAEEEEPVLQEVPSKLIDAVNIRFTTN